MVLRIGFGLLVIPAITIMVLYFSELSQVDACLEQGGSWNYTDEACDLKQSHPFIPFMVRFPLVVNGGMLLSCIGLLMCLKGLYWRKP